MRSMRSLRAQSLAHARLYACLLAVGLGLALGSTPVSAQSAAPELPQPSPHARVEQHVGLTDLSVDYSSPGVKGRKIWGALVPYDRPWRTGANAPTKLTASRNFVFGGKPVTAGTYALYMIPGKASWTVVLNSTLDTWGNDGFDPAKDVVRISIKPEAIRGRERMTFLFTATTDDATRLDLEWEKLRIGIPIQLETKSQVMASIDAAVGDAWRPHFASARYLLDSGGDLDKALGYVDQSVAIKATWWNKWVRAQILAKKSRASDAIVAADEALKLGAGDRVFEGFFKADIEKTVAGWKKKG